ncbi:DUF4114 domain-containing protein [Tenacibaculum maritimum]|uniref:DUF4114 domain-containing protein n=1 Tax=Tenacibaculum maritimum TaxID=107401 RepID=UPI00388DCE81
MRKFLLFITLSIAMLVSGQNYNYLGTYSSNGTPNYLENPGDNVSVSTLELIDNSLPGTFDIPTYFPHYLTSNYDYDIHVNQTTDVYVTFVEDNVGFRNTLGFFTYDVNNPPTSPPADEEVTIIFPNASRLGFGGGLEIGDKVKIGTFNAGTVISFVLLSNGWNGSEVTYGHWQLYSNPNLNSGTDPTLKQQTVLLKDDASSLIVLGYEDLHRDHTDCQSDSDFNDVIFYVSASEYSNLTTTNITSASISSDVYSSNLGGFESNGDLPMAIAEKNMVRLKENNELDKKEIQPTFNLNAYKAMNNLAAYFPETGMYDLEEGHISTSSDPINYSNATDVFSLDYYLYGERVLAGFVTTTDARIYDHSKHTCDRLNRSELIDVRTVLVNGHNMVFSIIKRDNGYIEYTLSFSVKKGDVENTLYSFWNISDYPEGDYINFQIWGKTMGQVANLVNHITNKLAEEKALVSNFAENTIPTVIVSSAAYKNEKLVLDIINTSGTKEVRVEASLREAEQNNHYSMKLPIRLSGNYYETIEIATGFIFDAGFSLINDENNTKDNFYVADGTWGIDFATDQSSLNSYVVYEQEEALNTAIYQVERGVSLSGNTKGTFNLFRYLLPGDLSLNTKDFDGIQLLMKNDHPVMISLVPSNINDWEDRWVYTALENTEETLVSIKFNQFHNQHGMNPGSIDDIRMVMFSADGTEEHPITFNLTVNNLALHNSAALSVDTFEVTTKEAFNYPNPFTESTTFSIPKASESVHLEVYDILGRTVYHKTLKTLSDRKSVRYDAIETTMGIYFYKITDDKNNTYKGKFMIID